MKPTLRLLAALFVLVAPAAAQGVDYTLSFEPGGDEWRVEGRFEARGQEELEFRIPVWTPGAYHPADYGRFVTELEARDGQGGVLQVERPDAGHFVISATGSEEEIVVSYRAGSMSTGQFTNDVIDVEANRIADDYAYVNPPSLFGFVAGRLDEPVRLTVELPDGWTAATVLQEDDQGAYLAPSYYRFEDSPLLFSPGLRRIGFEVEGKPHQVVVHGRDEEDARAIAAGCERIVEAGATLMGGLPYERYVFLFGFDRKNGGSGLEHSDSTLILLDSSIPVDDHSEGLWSVTAHEFFHLWCAERIHVEAIHDPDFTEPPETGTIWVNEGITEYFCRHLLFHAGFLDEHQLLSSFVKNRIPAEAMRRASWTDVSRATVDWAGMGDLMLFAMRMYMVGPQTIFALDMTMRAETGGERGIHDLLHHLVENYVDQDRGFGEDELDDVLEAVSGPEAVAFYERYIDGPEIPDPSEFLEVIGYALVDGEVVPVDDATPEQLRARDDYLSATGRP